MQPAAADLINQFCPGCSSSFSVATVLIVSKCLPIFTLKYLSIFIKHKDICVFESRTYFSVVRRNRLEENFFMEPNILSRYEGLGQCATLFILAVFSPFLQCAQAAERLRHLSQRIILK